MTAAEIRRRRLAYPFTRLELAALVGVTESAVNEWEGGRRTPRARNRRALEAVFGLRPWAEVNVLPLCRGCGVVPAARQRTECGSCHMQRWRQSQRGAA